MKTRLRRLILALYVYVAGAVSSAFAAPPEMINDDAAASSLIKQARDRIADGDPMGAVAAFNEAATLHGCTSTMKSRSTQRLLQEMSVVGLPLEARWFDSHIDDRYVDDRLIDLESGTTLLIFWETWCPHCQRELPGLQKEYEDYRSAGIEVIGLTRLTKSSTEKSVRKFVKEHELSLPIWKEDGQVASAISVSGIPAAAVVQDGVVIWRGHPGMLSPSEVRGMAMGPLMSDLRERGPLGSSLVVPPGSQACLDMAVVDTPIESSDIRDNIYQWLIPGDVDLESGVTLLVFFEEWCPHCRREVPKLAETQARYLSQGLRVVGLTRLTKSSTESKVMDLLGTYGVDYPVAYENGKIAERFQVSGIPAAAVVKDGVIIWRGHPSRLTEADWAKWL
jgi:thiol-disulfide isomerase/thioredoxin